MDKDMLLCTLTLLVSVFIASVSQVMLKKSAQINYRKPINEYLNPLVIGAYTLLLGTTFLSISAYRILPLSMGVVLETTSYIFITFFGIKIFGEKINRQKFGGLTLIIVGILVYSI